MKKLTAAFAFSMIVGMMGCGNPGAANVEACKKFMTAVKCGSVDISSSFNCDVYANTTCDISAYWDCATSHYSCSNGTYDSAKLAAFSADCASKAVCK